MSLDLKHYPRPNVDDPGPFTLDRHRLYDQTLRYDKPTGLWVSVKGDDDWQHWTQDNEFAEDTTIPANEHTVTLTGNAQILTLGSMAEVFKFSDQFSLDTSWRRDHGRGYRIDWPLIAAQWDGIIIAPYQWECRYADRMFWYYGWDCASGCIWNLNAIAAVTAPSVEVPA